ncbi:MAG: hypothetical protein ACNS62_06925 [Candidatus Cyclobacteriaceae bacterium M3_2C_046]
MQSPAKSLYYFGIYMILMVGIGFLIMPAIVLDMFQLNYGNDVWPRFVGMMAIIIGAYYIVAAHYNLKEMFIWTVLMRLFAFLCMVTLVVSGQTEQTVLLFAAADLSGAIWTWTAIRKDFKVKTTA